MVKFFDGDIFDCPTNVIAHQCNCFNTMGGGLARQIRERYPLADEVDKSTKKGDKTKLGRISVAECKDKTIINMYGQYKFGRDVCHTDYHALMMCLMNTYKYCVTNNKTSFAVPYKLGCGLAGGDWNKVKAMLEGAFTTRQNIKVYICKRDNDQ